MIPQPPVAPVAPAPKRVTPPPVRPTPPPRPPPETHRPGPLGTIPSSGGPGEAIALKDYLPPGTCKHGIVYVFFDHQLVAQSPEKGTAFADNDVVVPGDAQSGWHHFELNCTNVDPFISSARFEVLVSTDHVMGWVTTVPRVGNMETTAKTWIYSGGIALGLLALILIYLLGFPQEWFNHTYDENKERMVGAARRRWPHAFAERKSTGPVWRRTVVTTLLFVAFVAVGGFISSWIDPHFGWSRSSLWFFLGWCAAIAVVTLGFQLPAAVLGVQTRRTVAIRILLGSIVVAAVCVAVSRLLRLEPGYCYGLLAVFAFRPALEERQRGPLAAMSMLSVLFISLVAFAVWLPLQQTVSHQHHPSPAVIVIETMCSAVFIAGIESVSFGMVPLPFLPGREVARWNKIIWLGIFSVGTFFLAWMLLQPGAGYTRDVHHVDVLPVAAASAAFALVTVAFMAYHWLGRRREGPDGREPATTPGGMTAELLD